jgi:hypothetical protein
MPFPGKFGSILARVRDLCYTQLTTRRSCHLKQVAEVLEVHKI